MNDYTNLNITYRVLAGMQEFRQAADLEIAIWGLNPRDAVPVNLVRALSHAGGAMHGAFDGTRLIGIALAFPARMNGEIILWSHMTGVHRDYQGTGIGYQLKSHQREWALSFGYTVMGWTFDPLQRGNANFNLRHLGATARIYHTNFYGIMQDEINRADLPSDRLEVRWDLTTPPGEHRQKPRLRDTTAPEFPLLLSNHEGAPALATLDPTQPTYFVQIPPRLAALPDLARLLDWRLALRNALSSAFACGYTATGFDADYGYLLRHDECD
jgi:predicted GNAT superfamily acetyltransferase